MQASKSLLLLSLLAAGCASSESAYDDPMAAPVEAASAQRTEAAEYDKAGFSVYLEDGRLWVFHDGSEDLTQFLVVGEPAKHVTSIGTGPDGRTVKSPDTETRLAYLAACDGFATWIVDGRVWVFRDGDAAIEEFLSAGEPAKHITRIGVGPAGMTVKSPDGETIDAYLKALGI